MKRVINLHPGDNGAESVIATLEFKDRVISMSFEFPSYGQSMCKTTINFNNADDILPFIANLRDVFNVAHDYFAENP
jgi:hypothetical protein